MNILDMGGYGLHKDAGALFYKGLRGPAQNDINENIAELLAKVQFAAGRHCF